MLKLKVPDMTCGHCASVVSEAVHSVDANATVDIDLGTKAVSITTSSDPAEVTRALAAAGYPALLD